MLTKNFLLHLDENISKTFCVTDVETTGQKPEDSEIIEIASIKVKNGEIVDKYSSFIKPKKLIPEFITQITGIRNEDVKNAREASVVLKEWTEFSSGSDFFCAHNVMFDFDFIYKSLDVSGLPKNQMESMKFFCTVKAARLLYPDLVSRKLESLIKFFNIEVNKRHRALDDALATAKILLIFFNDIREKKKELLKMIEETQNDKIKTFEAAECLSVTKEKIYEMIKNGTLKVFETYTTKSGYEGYLFLRKDIEELALKELK